MRHFGSRLDQERGAVSQQPKMCVKQLCSLLSHSEKLFYTLFCLFSTLRPQPLMSNPCPANVRLMSGVKITCRQQGVSSPSEKKKLLYMFR